MQETNQLAVQKLEELNFVSASSIMSSSHTDVNIDIQKQDALILSVNEMSAEVKEQSDYMQTQLKEYQTSAQKMTNMSKSFLSKIFKNAVDNPRESINLNLLQNQLQAFLKDKQNDNNASSKYVETQSNELVSAVNNCDLQLEMLSIAWSDRKLSNEYLQLDEMAKAIVKTEFDDAKSLVLDKKLLNERHLQILNSLQLVIMGNEKELVKIEYLVPTLISYMMTAVHIQSLNESGESLRTMSGLAIDLMNETSENINKSLENQKIAKIEHEKHVNASINKAIASQEEFEAQWESFINPNSEYNKEIAKIRAEKEQNMNILFEKGGNLITQNQVLIKNIGK